MPPLLFHQVHGKNIKLSKNGTVAQRTEGFCKGIVFSDRPIMVYEPICIRFLEFTDQWSGALRIGFTNHDPNTFKKKMPPYVCPKLTEIPGNWAKPIEENVVKKESVLFYYVDQLGCVHYGIDTEEHEYFFLGVDVTTKLWAMLDIYGSVLKVELSDPHSLYPVYLSRVQSNLKSILENARDSIAESNPIYFHHHHGLNIFLKNRRSVASRRHGYHHNAYVFTHRPIQINEKIFLEILETDNCCIYSFVYGVTSCDPSSLKPIDLPEDSDKLLDRREYWVKKDENSIVKKGDIFTFYLTEKGEIKILKNDCLERVDLTVSMAQPLWLFLNLSQSVTDLKIFDEAAVCKCSKKKIRVERDNQEGASDTSMSECVTCCENPVDCVFYRCGHMCMCHGCAMKMRKVGEHAVCPICRKEIDDVIKTYK